MSRFRTESESLNYYHWNTFISTYPQSIQWECSGNKRHAASFPARYQVLGLPRSLAFCSCRNAGRSTAAALASQCHRFPALRSDFLWNCENTKIRSWMNINIWYISYTVSKQDYYSLEVSYTQTISPVSDFTRHQQLKKVHSSMLWGKAKFQRRNSLHCFTAITWERPVCQVKRGGGRPGPCLAPNEASSTGRLWGFQQVEWLLWPSHYCWRCMLKRTPTGNRRLLVTATEVGHT